MGVITGASAAVVKDHLFIICPNNSGSNVLRAALSASSATWNLEKEGQHTPGFQGPTTRGSGARLIWGAYEKWLSLFGDESAYDWEATAGFWYEQAYARSVDASVFVTSSPPFVLQVSALRTHFKGARFLFMVRDPYAVVEGICRRASQQNIGDEDIRIVAARHIMRCFAVQKHNIEKYVQDGVFCKYETLCAAPEAISSQIQAMLPAISDLDFSKNLTVKGMYDEPIRNMNADQIARLSPDDIATVNGVFEAHKSLLEFFEYDIITPTDR